MAATIIENVRNREPGCLRSEWFLNDDERTNYIGGLRPS